MIQKAKHDSMRNTNTLIVLACIKNYGPITKKSIHEKTGLSWGAISNITTDLLNKRIISEHIQEETSVGRTPSYLEMNDNENLLIGIDINISGLTIVLTDLNGSIKESYHNELASDKKADIISQVIGLIGSLMNKAELTKDKVLGIGVAMHGAVDVKKGVSVFAPHFKEWKNVPLKSILEKEFDIPVIVEHDPNCMAMSEKWFGIANEYNNYLFLRLSMGIGMSIIIDGEILRGAEGNAGEFGHIVMDPDGPKCSCGGYGCLEAFSSGTSILRMANEVLQSGRSPILNGLAKDGRQLNFDMLVAALSSGDEYIAKIADDACTYIGVGIGNLINLFNPELIIIAGELSGYEGIFIDRIKKVIEQRKWKASRANILVSNLESNSAALGSTAVIIQKFFKGEEISKLK